MLRDDLYYELNSISCNFVSFPCLLNMHSKIGQVETLLPITLTTRVRFRSGRVAGKSMRVSEVILSLYLNFISRLPPSMPQTGVYKRDWWGHANYLCLYFVMGPGTIKSWGKSSHGQQINFTPFSIHHTHAYISGGRALESHTLRPLKIVGAIRHAQRRTAW